MSSSFDEWISKDSVLEVENSLVSPENFKD